jgi:fluoroacetyl-CoA thioesterase
MIESMERAATRLMRPRLSPGESSQGVELKLTHAAATLPGGPMRYEATCRGTTGRLHHFLICAFDSSGLVATCEHTRAVVSPRRLLAQARRRAGRPSMLLEP